MVLATAKVEDFDRFWNTFSTKGADKRREHGSKGAQVLRDPNDADRIWVVFDWDDAGWQSFTSDPEVPAIFQEAGFVGVRPRPRSSSASTTRSPRPRTGLSKEAPLRAGLRFPEPPVHYSRVVDDGTAGRSRCISTGMATRASNRGRRSTAASTNWPSSRPRTGRRIETQRATIASLTGARRPTVPDPFQIGRLGRQARRGYA